jgi:hypothetical protein
MTEKSYETVHLTAQKTSCDLKFKGNISEDKDGLLVVWMEHHKKNLS